MPSIDETNKAIYTLLHADTQLLTLAPGDVWDTKADEHAVLPRCVFQRVTAVPDYTFGLTLADEQATYMFKAYAVDTSTKTGRELCAQIVDRAKTILRNAALAISGSVTLACYPTSDIPPLVEPNAEQRSTDTYQEGFYFAVYAA